MSRSIKLPAIPRGSSSVSQVVMLPTAAIHPPVRLLFSVSCPLRVINQVGSVDGYSCCYTWTKTTAGSVLRWFLMRAALSIPRCRRPLYALAADSPDIPGRCAARRGRQDGPTGQHPAARQADVDSEECLHRNSASFDVDNCTTT